MVAALLEQLGELRRRLRPDVEDEIVVGDVASASLVVAAALADSSLAQTTSTGSGTCPPLRAQLIA